MNSQDKENDIGLPIGEDENKHIDYWRNKILIDLKDRINRLRKNELTLACNLDPTDRSNLGILRRIVIADYLAHGYSFIDKNTPFRIILFVNDHYPLTEVPRGWNLNEKNPNIRFDLLAEKYPRFRDTWNDILRQINLLKDTFNITNLIFMSRFYSEGSMNGEIQNVLQHRLRINSYMRERLPEDTKYLPVYGYDKDGYIVREGRYRSNHLIYKDETIDLLNGDGGLSMEVEWASRWRLLEVDLEIHDEIGIDSLNDADWISRNIHNYESPLSVRCGGISEKGIRGNETNHPSIEHIVSLCPLWNLKHWILKVSIDLSLIYNEREVRKNINELIRDIDEYRKTKDDERIDSILPYVFRDQIPSWNSDKLNHYRVLRLFACICTKYTTNLNSIIEQKGELIRKYLDIRFDTPYDEELLEFFYKDWIRSYSKRRSWTILHRSEIRELNKLMENLMSNYKEEYINDLIRGNVNMRKAFHKVTSMSTDSGFNLFEIIELNGRSFTIDKINTAIESTGCYVMPWRELGRESRQG